MSCQSHVTGKGETHTMIQKLSGKVMVLGITKKSRSASISVADTQEKATDTNEWQSLRVAMQTGESCASCQPNTLKATVTYNS